MRVRVATKDDVDSILAIAVRNRTVKLADSDTFIAKAKRHLNNYNVLENSLGEIVGYSKIRRHNGNKVTIEAIGIKPAHRTKGYEKNLFEPIKSRYNIVEYTGRYAKSLGFTKGKYTRKVTNSFMSNNKEKLKTRKETLDGIEYLVAPVVMVKEQVLNGELLPRDEIAKSTPGWNGRPVVVYHPKNDDGEDVIANDPEVVPNYEVGRIYNAEYDEDTSKLKAEIWIDISKAKKKNKDTREALKMIENSDELEVSTGYIVNDYEAVSGEFDGVEYNAIQREILPDHLALLPKEIGACSWEDGAGVRNNTNKGIIQKIKSKLFGNSSISLQQTVNVAIRNKFENVDWVNDLIIDTNSGVNSAVFYQYNYDEDGEIKYPSKMMKVDYSVDEDGTVTIGDDPVEVESVTTYIPKTNSNKEDITVNKDKIVQAVIANSKGKLGRKDRSTLMNLADNVLISMLPATEQKKFKTNDGKKASSVTINEKAKEVVSNILKGRTVKVNEGEDVVIEALLTAAPEDAAATLEGLSVEELDAVATALDESIVVIETVAGVADSDTAAALQTVVESADAVLATVEDAIDNGGADTTEEDTATNADMTSITDPGTEEEEETVSAISSASTHRRKRETTTNGKKKKAPTMDEYIKNIPDPSVRDFIINGANAEKQRRNTLIATLAKNSKCQFTANELKVMSTTQLEKINKMVGEAQVAANSKVDYGIFGMQVSNQNEEELDYIPLSTNIFKGGK